MKIPDGVRTFNKHYLNRLTGKLARAGLSPFGMVYHVGRRSAKQYETPIWVFPSEGGFIIALTYGTHVDWYRNVLSAGQCRILYHHQEYAIKSIEPLERAAALPLFPRFVGTVLRLIGMQDFVRMAYQPQAG